MYTLPDLPHQAVGIIYAGGRGSRLWPVSTDAQPKQVNPLFSPHTLVVDAYERARKVFAADNILLFVTQAMFPMVHDLLPLPDSQFIIQPDTEDTAASMAIASMWMEFHRPGCCAVTLYADHVITDTDSFVSSLRDVLSIPSLTDMVITVGTEPRNADTQFGYIQKGKHISGRVFEISRFVEKPDRETASEFVKSGEYLWNTGIYVWRPEVILHQFKDLDPDTYQAAVDLRSEIGGPEFSHAIRHFHAIVKRHSFDKLIIEHASNLAVYKADFRWKDLGNWTAVYDMLKKDENGNAIIPNKKSKLIIIDSKGCLISPYQSTVSVIGLTDIIVIQTEHELLLCHAGSAAKVKEAVSRLETIKD